MHAADGLGGGSDAPPDSNVAPAGVFAELARSLAETTGLRPTLQEVVDYALVVVPCGWAAVAAMDAIESRPARLAASTDPQLMAIVAEVAGAAGTSPRWAAFLDGRVVHSRDLADEPRFPGYAQQMVARTPSRAVLSLGLQLREEPLGVLSLSASFGEDAIDRASLPAAHAAIAIEAELSANRADTLQAGLDSNRTIGSP
jgi:GAF domain-containing protein